MINVRSALSVFSLILVAIVMVLFAYAVAAQEVERSDDATTSLSATQNSFEEFGVPVNPGIYRPWTFPRRVKLGVAPLVNPSLVNSVDFLYAVPESALSEVDQDILVNMIESGEIDIGFYIKGSEEIVVFDKQDALSRIYDGNHSALGVGREFVVVSGSEKFLGQELEDRFVSWGESTSNKFTSEAPASD